VTSLGIDRESFRRLAEEYRREWEVVPLACRADGQIVWGRPCSDDEHEVTACTTRELAIREAWRWGEPTFELSASDQLLWAVPLMHNARLLGGLVACTDSRAAVSRLDLNRAAADLRRRAEEANVTNVAWLDARRTEVGRERYRAEAIHALKALPAFDLRQVYLLEEPALAAAIRQGDRHAAREILNRLLVGIHFCAGERLDAVKSLFLELVLTVSRTAVQAGAAPDDLVATNLAGLTHLATIDDEETLAHWLRDMLERALDTVRSARRHDDAPLLIQGLEYLREHFTEDVSRDEVARAACLSPAHFSRRFRQRFGRTFSEVLTEMRVDYAAELLSRTDKPVGLVALESGFADQSYFTKVFRRLKGVVPRQYRRHRAEEQAEPAGGRAPVGVE